MTENNIKDNIYWKVEEIRPYVIRYLKEKFPNSIIEREFGKVDIMVHGPKIPVEIQKTYTRKNGYPCISLFEDSTRRQIERNIDDCNICWLFIDNEFLSYLQNNSNLTRSSDIDMEWIYNFWKSKKLRIFTTTIKGNIKEILEDKEFDFLKKNEELLKLQRNRYDIAYKIYKDYNLKTEEIDNWYSEYMRNTDGSQFNNWIRRKNKRGEQLSNIRYALNSTYIINDMLICNMKNRRAITHAANLGIIEGNENNNGGGHSKHIWIRCADSHDILKHFPGYFENKELWDYWKTYTVHHDIFIKVVRGEYPNYLKDYKNQKNIEDAWS